MQQADSVRTNAVSEASPTTMRAVVHDRYGEPEVLSVGEVARPTPGPGEVLVRVHAACVSIGDHHVVTGKPYLVRLSPFGGLPTPRHRVPGASLSGRVEAIGPGVTSLRVGDEVIGQTLHGAFAEYVVMGEGLLAPRPRGLSWEEAAAVPWGTTALQGIRDVGGVKAGQRVLIHGASGAVGTWAVQIAVALGAEVTAVCGPRNVARMRALGASAVIDYTTQDFATAAGRYDVMFDAVGDRSLADCQRVLTPTGTYVACAGGGGDWLGPLLRLVWLGLSSLVTRRKLKTLLQTLRREDLLALTALVEAGKARPTIARTYPLDAAAEAMREVGTGHAQGQIVLQIAR